MADKPVTREEKYLSYLTGDYTGELQNPITRKEKYLYELYLKGIGGEISPEEIKNAVNEYLEKNPVKPGATTEQAQQIEQNRTDVASLKKETGSLKEDLSNKITKFYASSQGETHITDSDNGKIQDMMMYGKSEQVSTTGSQLLDLSVTPNAHRNQYVFDKTTGIYTHTVETTYDSNRWIISSNPNTDMIISCKNIENGMRIEVSRFLQNEANSTICTIDSSNKKATFNTKTWNEFTISIFGYATGKQTAEDIMLEKGTEAHSYEPYTGGQPSPSPDYPQEIKSVVNPTVKVVGKNLWNPIVGGYINGKDGSITEAPKKQMAVTDFIKTNGKDITVIARNFSSAIGNSYAYRIGFYNAEKKWIKNIIPSDGNKYSVNRFNITGTEYIRVSAPSGIYDTIQIEYGSEATPYEPYTEQSVQLPYTLNAIPVTSGGNVTIDGQQYIADYVNVERGKVVRNVENVTFNGAENENWELWNADKEKKWSFMFVNSLKTFTNESVSKCNRFEFNVDESIDRTFWICSPSGMPSLQIKNRIIGKDITAFKSWLSNNPINVIYPLRIPIEEELTAEHAQALKELATYYPVTNISIGSEQLDGYTVFNYPISMANGWNYVKKQLNDNRDYIYDMDIQSAEAYVNSEYAVVLTELEV